MLLSRFGIRWLLMGVGLAVLAVPVLLLLSLNAFDLYLAQETENRLLAQGAVIGEAYRALWSEEAGQALGDPRPPGQQHQRYTPMAPRLVDLSSVAPPFPSELPPRPARKDAAFRAGQRIEPLLRQSQIFHLAGVRVLDPEGCVVSTSRSEAGRCLHALSEVERALGGKYAAAVRARVSDEPPPAFGGLSRRGKLRVYSALPIFNSGEVIGVVLQSRTAQTAWEWLWQKRRHLLFAGGSVVLLGLLVAFGFARMLERPLTAMSQAARAIAAGRAPSIDLKRLSGPREISLLSRTLDDMTQRLKRRNQYITDFVATVSHELKSPLTSIQGAAELLSEQWDTVPAEQRLRFLGNIQAAARRTTRLAQRLLTLARAENPEPESHAEPLALSRVAAELEDRYGDEVSVQVLDPGGEIRIAPESLESVLGNLVDNACRYRREAPVQVTLQALPEDRTRIEVFNDGPPISEGNRKRLFQRFFTTERDQGGTGLGLAIVKAIADGRGGGVQVESDDQGTRFVALL